MPRSRPLLLTLVAAVAVAMATTPAQSATSGAVIRTVVASATNLSIAGCPPAARDIGTVLIGTTAVTSADCVVTFGSSNDAGHLRLFQTDRTGVAMSNWTAGALDPSWNAAPAGIRSVTPTGAEGWGGVTVAPTGEVYKGARATSTQHLAVARFTTGGTLDTTWNGDGYGTVDTGATVWPTDSTLDAQGRALIVGDGTASGAAVAVARLDTDGDPDTTFGGGDGLFTVDPDPAAPYTASATVLQADDGGYWVTGCTTTAATYRCLRSNGERLFVLRLQADGTPDPDFGTNGVLLHDPVQLSPGGGSILTEDGGLLLFAGNGTTGLTLLKLKSWGSLDAAFGTNGVATVALPGVTSPTPWSAMALGDGSVLLQGDVAAFNVTWLAKIGAGGSLDTTFGTGGVRVLDLFPGHSEHSDTGDLVPTGDGGAFFAGNYDAGGTYPYFVTRIDAAGAPHPSFGGGDGTVEIAVAGGESHHGGLAAADGRIYLGGGDGTIQLMRLGGDGMSVPDYDDPAANFASSGGAFGACLRTSSAATPTWTPAPGADCTGDGAHWHGIARTPGAAGSEVAVASNTTTATASLLFGFRPPAGGSGRFSAPLTFEVIAP